MLLETFSSAGKAWNNEQSTCLISTQRTTTTRLPIKYVFHALNTRIVFTFDIHSMLPTPMSIISYLSRASHCHKRHGDALFKHCLRRCWPSASAHVYIENACSAANRLVAASRAALADRLIMATRIQFSSRYRRENAK